MGNAGLVNFASHLKMLFSRSERSIIDKIIDRSTIDKIIDRSTIDKIIDRSTIGRMGRYLTDMQREGEKRRGSRFPLIRSKHLYSSSRQGDEFVAFDQRVDTIRRKKQVSRSYGYCAAHHIDKQTV
tara:strand:- start:134 stop:511 length:378 start_codon:yes stop_codon:yes gene_type:complete